MAFSELQMVRNRFGSILLILLISFSRLPAESNQLSRVAFEAKQNGLIVAFEFEKPMSPDSISAWQAGSGWFYFTLYNVDADSTNLSKTRTPREILTFQPIVTPESTQLGIRLRQPIDQYDIVQVEHPNRLVANLHYPAEQFASLPAVSEYQQEQRQFSSRFKRTRSWLYITGAGLTMTGLLKGESVSAEKNWELVTGIVTLAATYILDKLWPKP